MPNILESHVFDRRALIEFLHQFCSSTPWVILVRKWPIWIKFKASLEISDSGKQYIPFEDQFLLKWQQEEGSSPMTNRQENFQLLEDN